MQPKILFALLIYTLIVFPSYSQVDSANFDRINSVDNTGQKIGLWIENDGLFEAYYKDGERDGIFKSYYRKNRILAVFGEYTNGNRTGTWYYFNEISQIDMIESDISTNDDLQILRDNSEFVTPKFKSFLSFYYPNGTIKEEGIALYDEDIEIDFFKYETWKYYNADRELIKIENHCQVDTAEQKSKWNIGETFEIKEDTRTTIILYDQDSSEVYYLFDNTLDKNCSIRFVLSHRFWNHDQKSSDEIIYPFPPLKSKIYYLKYSTVDTSFVKKFIYIK